MNYEYLPYNSAFYAAMLRYEPQNRRLMWDSAKGCKCLVLQCSYGAFPFSEMERLCGLLSEGRRQEDVYFELEGGIWARIVTPAQKVRDRGCPIHGEASCYAVFCCGDAGAIYAPRQEKRSCVNVPAEIEVEISRQMRPRFKMLGLYQEMEPTAFYCLRFAKPGVGYQDGDLFLLVSRLKIPVTGQMLEQGEIYIKTDQPPAIESKNPGLKIQSKSQGGYHVGI